MSVKGHLGNYNTGSSRTHVRFGFSTHEAAGGNVAPNSAFEAADLRIYKATDGAALSATQRSSADGITMTSPFDSLTGVHTVLIDLSDNTDNGFYASGCYYEVWLCPDETVDGQTITGICLCSFEIGAASPEVYNIVNSGTHGNAALKSLIDVVDNFIDTEIGDIQGRLPAALTGDGNMKCDALAFSGSATAADNVELVFDTNFSNAYNPTANAWSADVTYFNGVAGTFIGNLPSVNLTRIAGTAASATNLNTAFATATGSQLTALATQASVNALNNITAADVWAAATRTLTALDEDTTTIDLDATIRAAVGLASANLDTQLADLPTVAEFEARTLAAADYATATALDAVDNYLDTELAALTTSVGALWTTALTEAYRADGAAPTPAQALCEMLAHHGEVAITGTSKRLNKFDGSTQAMIFTLNDSVTPTAVTRSS